MPKVLTGGAKWSILPKSERALGVIFLGNTLATLDAKQRLAIPAKFRGALTPGETGHEWILMPWPDGALRLYLREDFEKLAGADQAGLFVDPDRARLQKAFFQLAEPMKTDSAWRIVVSKELAARVGIDKDVVVVGAGSWVEVRDRAKWLADSEAEFHALPGLIATVQAKQAGK